MSNTSIKFILIIFIIILFLQNYFCIFPRDKKFDHNFNFNDYQKYIIDDKMKQKAGWELNENQIFFLNGIIRKYLPKNCLEIGVSEGGSSILILNAIKDISNSFLISLDLNPNLYKNKSQMTGWRVKKFFPELINKWSLYTGDQPHKFLNKLNLKFDFLFLDTAHISPGELFNLIEVLPFLNENIKFFNII